MTSAQRLGSNLRYLRLQANFTQDQMSEVTGFHLKHYQTIEAGRKLLFRIDTVERLGKPFGIEPWQLLAPATIMQKAKVQAPRPKTRSPRGPRKLR